MDTTKTANIQFESVHLSSLKSVVNIYQNKVNETLNSDRQLSKFKSDFGLPLSIASSENKVVGYAFVTVNKTGKPEINSYWEKNFFSVEAEQDLKLHAENTCHSLFADSETRSLKIQNAAEKLSNWLEVCN